MQLYSLDRLLSGLASKQASKRSNCGSSAIIAAVLGARKRAPFPLQGCVLYRPVGLCGGPVCETPDSRFGFGTMLLQEAAKPS